MDALNVTASDSSLTLLLSLVALIWAWTTLRSSTPNLSILHVVLTTGSRVGRSVKAGTVLVAGSIRGALLRLGLVTFTERVSRDAKPTNPTAMGAGPLLWRDPVGPSGPVEGLSHWIPVSGSTRPRGRMYEGIKPSAAFLAQLSAKEREWFETGTEAPPEEPKMTKPVGSSLYLIGSLRNPEIPIVAARLRAEGWDVFDDWFAAGPEADDWWQKYENARGRTCAEALKGHSAQHVFQYDKSHLDRCDVVLLVLPAGKSGHLELGYALGTGKPAYILLNGEPERYDVMYAFADGVFTSVEQFIEEVES